MCQFCDIWEVPRSGHPKKRPPSVAWSRSTLSRAHADPHADPSANPCADPGLRSCAPRRTAMSVHQLCTSK
eukprot:7654506-Alexandrium_andersonii.AAC.1